MHDCVYTCMWSLKNRAELTINSILVNCNTSRLCRPSYQRNFSPVYCYSDRFVYKILLKADKKDGRQVNVNCGGLYLKKWRQDMDVEYML